MENANELIKAMQLLMGNAYLLAFSTLFVLGYMLKEYTRLNNKLIPWVLFGAGMGLGATLIQLSLSGVLVGAVMSWVVMGCYEHIKNTLEAFIKYRLSKKIP